MVCFTNFGNIISYTLDERLAGKVLPTTEEMRELSLNNCRLDRRYDIQSRLGRGSYAEIYLASDVLASPHSPHSTVVIKALNVFLQDDLDPELERTLVENFQNEAVALDLVRHPNIISRLGHGTARDLEGTIFHYLVLEYCAGGDLQKLCRQESIGLKRALKFIEQTCAGLRYAHEKGVIHRDIKPQNLLLTKDHETVKIADFGVARLSNSDTPITRVGTNIYAPPEHSPLTVDANSNSLKGKLTPAADIYSLAKTMYSIITCEAPRYFANQPIESLPLTCRDASWSEELLRVLRRATQNDPTARYQSIDELWIDMTRLREIADNGEPSVRTRVQASRVPQPHVTRGYSPLAPTKPRFESTGDLRLANTALPATISGVAGSADQPSAAVIVGMGSPRAIHDPLEHRPYEDEQQNPADNDASNKGRRARRFVRRVSAFMASLVILGGVLYGTGSLLQGKGYLPQITGAWRQRTATANTDIFLRPEPNTNNDPIGLVTRNSKVRIVNSQNNWYQVDVIEQGRQRASQGLTATRGWLNGKYINIDD